MLSNSAKNINPQSYLTLKRIIFTNPQIRPKSPKTQNAQLKKEYEESQVELEKSKKYNRIMLIISLVSIAIAISSFVVSIIK